MTIMLLLEAIAENVLESKKLDFDQCVLVKVNVALSVNSMLRPLLTIEDTLWKHNVFLENETKTEFSNLLKKVSLRPRLQYRPSEIENAVYFEKANVPNLLWGKILSLLCHNVSFFAAESWCGLGRSCRRCRLSDTIFKWYNTASIWHSHKCGLLVEFAWRWNSSQVWNLGSKVSSCPQRQ